ncbi:methyltransferase domain-containing protein [Dokdonia sp. Hel_I_53]|uniref:methyltransferase domain-containing protein n=1 Tax=Dokdonia sp. Hel_I_53 TaxID=1566287 RepID=UPI00119949A3|nr:methyltransferase domain-containing protein [Dokdonia sp. Hel_I_53]TVZ52421.1 thiopurine S-methyltransferase [Dokdonia sp. Hel_I_53]
MKLDRHYWNHRYQEDQTGWDLKKVSPPLKEYFDQLTDKSLKILIPGGGYSYEAQYLWEQGFKNVYVIDYSEIALNDLRNRVPAFAKAQLIQGDFFELEDSFDLIIEQTFFCALDPQLRKDYVIKMNNLLNPNGKLVGLFFDFPLTNEGPPFGGNAKLYKAYFTKYFRIEKLERAYNSAEGRQGKELFFKFLKRL